MNLFGVCKYKKSMILNRIVSVDNSQTTNCIK